MRDLEIDHFSLNVSDHERSTRFYCEGLGFKHVDDQTYDGTNAEGAFLIHCRFLEGGGLTLVLNRAEVPSIPVPEYRQQYGLNNFAIRVADLDASVERLQALGATPVESSRGTYSVPDGEVRVIVVLDPDGQPVELIERQAQGP